MVETDILVIGAGIAGLSAGCHAQANGFSSVILEKHSLPGGLCTSWTRNGYVFDYCIHWLVGSGKNHAFRKLWDFLDIAPLENIVNHGIFTTRISDDGTPVHWYTNADRLAEHLLGFARFEEDKVLIRRLAGWIRKMGTFTLMEPDFSPAGLLKMLGSLPALKAIREVKGKTWADFAGQFKTPLLRENMLAFFDMKGFPVMGVIFTLGSMHGKNAGYPLGASLKMAKRVEARYQSLGGHVEYGKEVEEVLVEDGRAVGARCTDGSEYRARWVISAADAHSTIYGLLGNRFPSPIWDRAFATMKPFPSPVMASFGVRLDAPTGGDAGRSLLGLRLDDAAATISYKLKTPLRIEDHFEERVGFHHYAFDPSMGPVHGTPVTFLFNGTNSWWRALASDPVAYKAEKERILDDLTGALEELMPGFTQRIETRDLATPMTNIRYTGNWEGSQEGFMMADTDSTLPSTLPGLARFLLCGQWLHPGGGIPPSAMEGRTVVRTICRAENRSGRLRRG
jgi:phytoene dehydrogenase-like protein